MATRLMVPRDILIAMLQREHELRTCPETQAMYAAAETSFDTDWMEETSKMQEQLVKDFGFNASPAQTARAVNELRRATWNHPGDAEIASIPLYVKYNRARRGTLRVGDVCPDVPLLAYTAVDGPGEASVSPVLGRPDVAPLGPGCGAGCGAGTCGDSGGCAVDGVGRLPTITSCRTVSLLEGPHVQVPGLPLLVLAGSYS